MNNNRQARGRVPSYQSRRMQKSHKMPQFLVLIISIQAVLANLTSPSGVNVYEVW